MENPPGQRRSGTKLVPARGGWKDFKEHLQGAAKGAKGGNLVI